MKFVHTSDLHIGACRRLKDHFDRQKKILYQIKDIVLLHRARVLVIAGDICDNKELLPRERDLLIQWFIDLDNEGITVIAVSGNHDQISNKPGDTNLAWLRILAEEKRLKAVIEDRKPRLVNSWGIEWGLVPGWQLNDGEMQFVIDSLLEQAKGDRVIMVVHESFAGARYDNDFEAPDSLPKLEEKKRVLYWALGDVHVSQANNILGNAFYCGAPAQFKFGDSFKKGVLVVDTDDPMNPKFVKLKGIKKFVVVRGASEIKNAPRNAYVKVVLNEQSPELDLSGLDVIQKEITIRPLGRRLTQDPLDGLRGFLKNQGVKNRRLLKRIIQEAKSIKREAGY